MSAVSGELRRRKNAPKSSDGPSVPVETSSRDDDDVHASARKKRPRPSSSSKSNDYDEYAWLAVFLAALSYFIITRGGSSNRGGVLSSFSRPYDVISSSVGLADGNKESEALLRSTFYVAKSQRETSSSLVLEANRRLEVILSSPPDVIESYHDEECSSSDDGSGQKQQPVPYLSHLS